MTPQFFATKVHGFDPERWGGLGFPRDSDLNNAIEKLGNCPENFVVHIATEGVETERHERGLVLGIARVSDRPIETKRLVDAKLWQETLTRHNSIRWPKALPYLEAWRFESPPHETQILPRFRDNNLSIVLGTTVLPLTNDEATAIYQLNTKRASIYPYSGLVAELQHNARRRVLRDRQTLWQPPPPTFGTFIYEKQDGPAHTYRAKLAGELSGSMCGNDTSISKVGWTHDLDARQSNLNFGSPDLRQLRWEMDWRFTHESRSGAELMERRILQDLHSYIAPYAGSQEILLASEAIVRRAWSRAMDLALQTEH